MVRSSPYTLELCRSINWNLFHPREGKHDNPKPYHEDNPSHKLFSEKSAVIISRLLSINRFWEETFEKRGTNRKFIDNAHEFAELITSVGQQQYEHFVYSRLITSTKKLSGTKDSFISPATKQKRHTTDPNNVKMKDTGFKKLKAATAAWPSETEALFSNKFTSFLECQIKECHRYHRIVLKYLFKYLFLAQIFQSIIQRCEMLLSTFSFWRVKMFRVTKHSHKWSYL